MYYSFNDKCVLKEIYSSVLFSHGYHTVYREHTIPCNVTSIVRQPHVYTKETIGQYLFPIIFDTLISSNITVEQITLIGTIKYFYSQQCQLKNYHKKVHTVCKSAGLLYTSNNSIIIGIK